jgi:hypothetical protein
VLDKLIGTEAGVYRGERFLLPGDRFWHRSSRDLFARRVDHGQDGRTTYPCPRPNRFCRAKWPVRHDKLEAAFRRAVIEGRGEIVVPFDVS